MGYHLVTSTTISTVKPGWFLAGPSSSSVHSAARTSESFAVFLHLRDESRN